MQEGIEKEMLARAKALLSDGTVNRVIGWKKGLFGYDVTPGVFSTAEELDGSFLYNEFCGANLSKYLIAQSRKEGKILAFLKPCDTYSFNQLVKEHRILRDHVYVVGVPCMDFRDVPEGGTLEEILRFTEMRDQADSARYQELYRINNQDISAADLVVDTEQELPEAIVGRITEVLLERGLIAPV